MKIKNYTEMRLKREALKNETWETIATHAKTAFPQIPLSKIEDWFRLENRRLRRPEYRSEFRAARERIFHKCHLYLKNRPEFEKRHTELLDEIDRDQHYIEARNEAYEDNEAIYIQKMEARSKYKDVTADIANLKEKIREATLRHNNIIRDLQKVLYDAKNKQSAEMSALRLELDKLKLEKNELEFKKL